MLINRRRSINLIKKLPIFLFMMGVFSFLNIPASQLKEGCIVIPYEGQPAKDNILMNLAGGAICQYKVHPKLPPYVFHLIGDPKDTLLTRIEVKKLNTQIQVLKLSLETQVAAYRNAFFPDFFTLEDMNFDGYRDMKLLTAWGATGNMPYDFWVFDPKTESFVFNEELSGLVNPVVNIKEKTISTHGVGGSAGCIYTNRTFQFSDQGKLNLIYEEQQNWNEEKQHFVKTISKLKNGKMEVVKTVIIKE